jgi:hypothetical protein
LLTSAQPACGLTLDVIAMESDFPFSGVFSKDNSWSGSGSSVKGIVPDGLANVHPLD